MYKILFAVCLVGCYRPSIETVPVSPATLPPYGTAVICPRGTTARVSLDKISDDSLPRVIVICRVAKQQLFPRATTLESARTHSTQLIPVQALFSSLPGSFPATAPNS